MDINNYKNLQGNFIELKELSEDDAELIYQWRTGPSGEFMNQPENYSISSQKKWMQNRPANELNYMIVSKRSGEKVGMIAIVGISEQDKTAEAGRLFLAPEYLKVSNPYGLEALKICYNVILNEWKFNKVYGNILSVNPMLKLQKYLGMVEEGVLKDHKIINNQKYDLHLVAIFPDRLNKLYIPRIELLLKAFR